MKRIFAIVLVLCFVLCLSVSLSGCTDTATNFSESTIENGYYNYMSGGKMASVDGSLYINLVTNSLYMGTFKVSDEGTALLFDEHLNFDYFVDAPSMYQFNDEIYFIDPDESRISVFDKKTDSLKEQTLDVDLGLGVCYLSENLNVCIDSQQEHLIVKYQDNDEISLDETVSSFAVYEDKIYFISHDGWLYMNDPSKLKSECEFLSELNSNGVLTKILVCNGYCYFTDTGSDASGGKDALYRYSFENGTIELVLQQEVLSMNVQGDKVYFATDKGVYVDDSENCEKFSNKKADEIYIFDDEWIYLYNSDKGKIFRVSNDGAVTQKIS